MKYYIVVTPFFPEERNFRGSFIHDQMKALRALRPEYKYIVYRPLQPWQESDDYVFDGFDVRFFKAALTPSNILSGIFNNLNGHLFARRLRSDGIFADDIVAIHCHTTTCGGYGLILKQRNPTIKFLIQHHDLDPYGIRNGRWSDKSWNLKARAHFSRNLFKHADMHLCVSRQCEQLLHSFPDYDGPYQDFKKKTGILKNSGFHGADDLNLYTLYNGVDTSLYYPLPKSPTSIFTVGVVGNFVDWKEQMTLLKAMAIVNEKYPDIDWRLLLVGTGPTLDQCRAFAATKLPENRVKFITEIPHESLPDFYRGLDLFVLPSIFEGFGCVFTEAYACGVPFMVCRGQGAAEYILPEEEDQWILTPHDSSDIARKIVSYYHNKPKQHLSHTYDISMLVERFLNHVGL